MKLNDYSEVHLIIMTEAVPSASDLQQGNRQGTRESNPAFLSECTLSFSYEWPWNTPFSSIIIVCASQ